MLIAHGAKLDSTDNDGLTPLAIAAQNAKVNAARVLLDAGADVNARGRERRIHTLDARIDFRLERTGDFADRAWRESERRQSRAA